MSLIFTRDQISKMNFERTPNKVLVKPNRGTNEILLSNGVKIFMDNRFGKEKHAPTTGTVIRHCGKLSDFRMPWITTNELQEGDYIIYSFESAMYAMEDIYGRVLLDENKEPYFIIDYEDIFCIKREEQIIPVNGYLLVAPLEEGSVSSFQIIKEDHNSSRYGIVVHVGQRNKAYHDFGMLRETYDMEEEINPGDIIIFNRNSDLPVEYPLHRSLNGKSQTFFRLQRKDIDGIIAPEEKKSFGI